MRICMDCGKKKKNREFMPSNYKCLSCWALQLEWPALSPSEALLLLRPESKVDFFWNKMYGCTLYDAGQFTNQVEGEVTILRVGVPLCLPKKYHQDISLRIPNFDSYFDSDKELLHFVESKFENNRMLDKKYGAGRIHAGPAVFKNNRN